MNCPALTDPAVLVTAIAAALAPFCDPGFAEEIARNSVHAIVYGDGASPRIVIADAMLRRARHVRHVVRASELAERAYAVAERPESQRSRYLLALGVDNPTTYLREHGLLRAVRTEAA